MACLASLLTLSTAQAVPVKVRGSATFDARVTEGAGSTRIAGKLADDAGAALAGAEVEVSVVRDGKPTPPPEPRSCARGGPWLAPNAAGVLAIRTTEGGEFCLSLGSLPAGAVLRLAFAGDELHESAQLERGASEARAATTAITLDERVAFLDLDEPRQRISGRVELTAGRAPGSLIGLEVTLRDESARELGATTTRDGGAFSFDVASETLGDPGPGELVFRFAGSADLSEATLVNPVFRRAVVGLSLVDEPEPADPEEGVPIRVRVSTLRGPVPEGVVEALIGSSGVGTGAVAGGECEVIATFPRGRADAEDLTVGYVPSSPGYVAGPPLAMQVRLEPPSHLADLILASIVLGIAAWVAASWRRAPKARRDESEPLSAPPSGRPGLHVVRPATTRTGWSGIVVDAHDGAPIVGAVLRIVAPAFEGDGVVAHTTSGERGEFALDGSARGDATLVVWSASHSEFEQALPPPSVVTIALVTRRRALVARLVRWARQQGGPFDGPPEPTPGHVRRAATRAGVTHVSKWAEGVEQAAFGREEVDAETEGRLRSNEPKPLSGS